MSIQDSETSRGLPSGRGLSAYLAAMREAEAVLMAHPGLTDTEIGEAYNYLAGMGLFHLERAFKSFDLNRPAFVRDMDNFRTWGLPTPDHHYYSAEIDGDGTYHILGQRGNTTDYCFEIISGLAGDDGVVGDRYDALEATSLTLEPDGRFELWVGGPERERNWLRTRPGPCTIFVRQTVCDWTTEQPTPMLIERMDPPAQAAPKRPSNAQVQDIYTRAGKRLVDQVRFLDNFAKNWSGILPVNEYPAPAVGPADAGYFPGQFNTKGRWEIADDKALVITLEPNDAAYQSLALAHPIWFNLIDCRNVQSSLTNAHSRPSSDGRFRFVIAASDPGVWNWLDTGGLLNGFIFMRFQQLRSGRPPAAPVTKLVPLGCVRDEFPADEPAVGADVRQANERLRRLSSDRRYA